MDDKLVLLIIAKPEPTTGTGKRSLYVTGIAVVNGVARDIDIESSVENITKLVDLIEEICAGG